MTNEEIKALVAKQAILDKIGGVITNLENAIDQETDGIRLLMDRTGNHIPVELTDDPDFVKHLRNDLYDLFVESYERLSNEMEEMKICVPIPDADTKSLYHIKNIL